MKKNTILIFIAVIILLTSLPSCSRDEQISLTVGEKFFEDIHTTTLDGTPVDSTVFEGHILTMVNVWGTFCNPCIKEMPFLEELNSQFAQDGFQVIGIVSDIGDRNANLIPEKVEEATKLVEKLGLTYTQLVPSKSLNDSLLDKIQYLPYTVFINENGEMIGNEYVGSKSKSEWEVLIKKLIGEIK